MDGSIRQNCQFEGDRPTFWDAQPVKAGERWGIVNDSTNQGGTEKRIKSNIHV